jgi:uncharacterized cupredoxin-like copper-binding protein
LVKGDKATEGNRVLGEVEELGPGKTGQKTLTLRAGKYVLQCNIPDHYMLGMATTISAN